MSPRLPQHMCKTAEHYTPALYVEAARFVLGDIDLDPATCFAANTVVRAHRTYGLSDTWFRKRPENGLELPWGGRVFINPPGDRSGQLIKQFWRRANEHAIFGGPGAVVLWVGFSLEQLRSLQNRCGALHGLQCPKPQDWPHVIRNARISWEKRYFDYVTGVWRSEPGRNPPIGSYFCLLGGDREQRARFRERFGSFGAYVRGTRRPRAPRQLDREVLAAIRAHGPLSKRALSRLVKARTSSVLAAVESLIEREQLVLRNRKIAFPAARETLSVESSQ